MMFGVIEEMEAGHEIDALVAERVMGWHKIHEEADGLEWNYWCFTRTKETHPGQNEEWIARHPSETSGWFDSYSQKEELPGWVMMGIGWKGVWCPSTDIKAAWEVEDAIEKRGLKYRYVQALCAVFLYDGVSLDEDDDSDEGLWWIFAHATPHQRSRAALIVVEKGER